MLTWLCLHYSRICIQTRLHFTRIMKRKTIAATRVDNSYQRLYNGDTREADHTHLVE